MFIRLLLFFILSLFAVKGATQNPFEALSPDSITSLLASSQADTQAVYLKNVYSEKICDADPQKALQYATSALELAQSLGFTKGEAISQKNLGHSYSRLGKKDDALKAFEQAETLATQLKQQLLLGQVWFTRGNMHFNFGEYETSLNYHQKAFELLKVHGTNAMLASSHNSLGVLNYMDPDKQLFHYGEAGRLAKETGNRSMQAIVSLNIGDIYRNRKGDFEQALKQYTEASVGFDSINNQRGLAASLYQIGGIYTAWEQYGEALKYHQQAYAIRDSMGDQNGLLASTAQIAEVYIDMEEFDKAIDYCKKGLVVSKEVQNELNEGMLYNIIGLGQFRKALYDSAQTTTQIALKLFQKLDNKRMQGASLALLADIASATGNKQNALNLIQKALTLAEETSDTRKIGQYSGTLATLYLSMSDTDRDRMTIPFVKMESILQSSLKIANETKEYDFQEQMYKGLIFLYKEQGRYPNRIMAYQDSLLKIKDSLFNQNKAAELGEWATKLETAEKEKAIQLLEKQQEIDAQEKALLSARNRLALVIGLALLALLILGVFLYQKLRTNKMKIESQNADLQELNATKDKFFSIIAHDLRSPVSALEGVGEQMRYYMKKGNEEKLVRLATGTDRTATRLSRLLDNLLNWALLQKGSIPYNPEKINVHQVAEEITVLYEEAASLKSITIANQVVDAVHVFADPQSFNTILRNLVNNAVKFTPEGGEVRIIAQSENGRTSVSVIDNGIGIPQHKIATMFDLGLNQKKGTAGEKGSGLGLVLCHELATLNKGSIKVESELDKGSRFVVTLPATDQS
ncbi:MAG: tetratricopeptide repeat protein [Bacteroidia bacterium]